MHRAEIGDTQAVMAPLRGELYHLHSMFLFPFLFSIKWENDDSRFALAESWIHSPVFCIYWRYEIPAFVWTFEPEAVDDGMGTEGDGLEKFFISSSPLLLFSSRSTPQAVRDE